MRIEEAPRDSQGRPIVDACYGALLGAITLATPEHLGHVDPRRILCVAGAARGASIASIRPLTYGGTPPARRRGRYDKALIVIDGDEKLYEICLRPRFFLEGTEESRLEILAHELWHISPAFDGTLAPDRSHAHMGPGGVEREIRTLVDRIERSSSGGAIDRALLALTGELRLRAWSRRPPSQEPTPALKAYDERDLYLAIVEQRTLPR